MGFWDVLWYAFMAVGLLVFVVGGAMSGACSVRPRDSFGLRAMALFAGILSMSGTFLVIACQASHSDIQAIFGERWFHFSMQWSSNGPFYHLYVHKAAMLCAPVPFAAGVFVGLVSRCFTKDSSKGAKQQAAAVLMSTRV